MDALSKNAKVWAYVGEHWKQGFLHSIDKDDYLVAFADGTLQVFPTSLVAPANPPLLQAVPDLTQLSFLNEPSILNVLQDRYNSTTIYTTAGPVLIAVNPFKPVPYMYSFDVAQQHRDGTALSPHIFGVADKAYKQMKLTGDNQSILITGESGAGKTESAKKVMQYVAGAVAGGNGMERRVLGTNCILEAFGNAKTVHNNNSSRFGKLIQIQFSSSFRIIGAQVETYLLEKSRVARRGDGERNFHAFYQLLKGASKDLASKLHLNHAPEYFSYLQSCISIRDVDDSAGFQEVCEAMSAVGIDTAEQEKTWHALAAVLWLGNINFQLKAGAEEGCIVSTTESLKTAASLLGCSTDALAQALTFKRLIVSDEVISRPRGIVAAQGARDALAKALYEAVFKRTVFQINKKLRCSPGAQLGPTLGILDIAGFECLIKNGFEQLCINYANEALQRQFNRHLFCVEQAVYEEEGIDWAHIPFEDNHECVELIECRKNSGILALLDEECLFPKGCDSNFVLKLRSSKSDHPRFAVHDLDLAQEFRIRHYAGPVKYDATGFLDRNKDDLSPELVELVADGSSVKEIMRELGHQLETVANSQTVGSRFRGQLKDLVTTLDSTSLHFVRCIKPNGNQAAGQFEADLVLHQLRCCGVLEVARIAQAGYPTRFPHAAFADRYRILLPDIARSEDALNDCLSLLRVFQVSEDGYRVGKSRLFFRAGVLGSLENMAARKVEAATTVQAMWRMVIARNNLKRQKSSAILIQAMWRGKLARVSYEKMVRRHRSAVTIQSRYRGYMARLQHQKMIMAAQQQVMDRVFPLNIESSGRTVQEEDSPICAHEVNELASQPLEKEFRMSTSEIRAVLSLWQGKGKDIMLWLDSNMEGNSPDSPTIAANRQQEEDEDGQSSSVSSDLHATPHKSEEELKSKLSLMETYALRLEAKYREAQEEALLLRRAVAALEAVAPLGSSQKSHGRAILEASPGKEGRRHSFAMSELSTGSHRAPYQQTPPSNLPLTALHTEFFQRQELFTDDADFLREVGDGLTQAPGMDAEEELAALVRKYKLWKRDFKAKVKLAHQSLNVKQKGNLSGRLLGNLTSRRRSRTPVV